MAKLLLISVWRSFLEMSGSWWFMFTLATAVFVPPLVALFLWSSIQPGDPLLASYYLAVIVVGLMSSSYENHTFSEGIYTGTISAELVKPQPVVFDVIGLNLGVRFWTTILGLPIVVVAAFLAKATFDWRLVLLAIPAVVLAAALKFVWVFMFAMAAFWTERVHGAMAFGQVPIFLLGGSAAPIAFLPEPMQSIALVLPFRAMLGFPAELATGSLSAQEVVIGYGYQIGWLTALTALAIVVWRAGIRRYTVVGA